MNPTSQSVLSGILALLPTPYLQASLKALRFLLLRGHGKAARPQNAETKSPSALSRFLNRYPWPTRALLRLAKKEAQKTLDRARRRRGPKPRLLVVLDLVTLEKRGRFPNLRLPGRGSLGQSNPGYAKKALPLRIRHHSHHPLMQSKPKETKRPSTMVPG